MTVITPKRAIPFLEQLPIEDFYGVGTRSAEKMHELDIYTGADLKKLSQDECIRYFGKAGLALYERVRGVDDRPVKVTRIRKSIGKERTFYPFLYHDNEVEETLRKLANSEIGRASCRERVCNRGDEDIVIEQDRVLESV